LLLRHVPRQLGRVDQDGEVERVGDRERRRVDRDHGDLADTGCAGSAGVLRAGRVDLGERHGDDGTSAVVDCGFVALVVDPVLTVPPAGSTYCATTSVDGALTVTVVDAGRVMSSESSSPSPVADGTFMITVAEALSPDPSGPKLHVASPADFVHEPEEVTLTMLNPAGAGASRVVFGSEWDVPLWKVV